MLQVAVSQHEESKKGSKPAGWGIKTTAKPLTMDYTLVFEAIKAVLTSCREITQREEEAIVGALRTQEFQSKDVETLLRMIAHQPQKNINLINI